MTAGSLNDISFNIKDQLIYVTSNDGMLYRIDLQKTKSLDEEDDDFLDDQGDDGDQIDGDLNDEDAEDDGDDGDDGGQE